MAGVVDRCVGLGHRVLVLLVGGEEDDLVGDPGDDPDPFDALLGQPPHVLGVQHAAGAKGVGVLAEGLAGEQAALPGVVCRHLAVDAAEGGLDEAELVDPGKGRQRSDQADVRTLGGLDRADPAVVAVVDVADVEAGALPGEAARPERGEAPLVGQLGQRVGLVHELGELGGAEELLDRRHHRAGVDQARRRDRRRVADGHPLLDDPLHPDQAHPELVLEQLADRAHPAVAEVVDVVGLAHAVVERDQLADDRDEVLVVEDPALLVQGPLPGLVLGDAEVLVQLEAPHLAEVEAAGVEEERAEQVAGVLHRGRVAGADLAVELDQRLLDGGGGVLLQGGRDIGVLGVVVDVGEEGADVVVAGVAEGPHQGGHRHLALAVDLDREHVLARGLDLQPGAPVGDELGREEHPAGDPVLAAGEVDARGAHQLADHDPLGAVDDEGPLRGHHGEVAHEDLGLLDLARVLTGLDVEAGVDPQRGAEGHVPLPALLLVVLGGPELVVQEPQLVVLTGVVRDRVDLVEELAQPLPAEPRERIQLRLDEVPHLQLVGDLAITVSAGGCGSRKDHVLEFP